VSSDDTYPGQPPEIRSNPAARPAPPAALPSRSWRSPAPAIR